MNDHLPHDDEEFRGLTRQQIQDRMERDDAYDLIDRYLRNNMHDGDYANFSAALELVYARPAVEPADFQTWWDRTAHPFFIESEARLWWGYSRSVVVDRLEFLEAELAQEPAAPVAEQEPVAWRFRYRSKPGMIGNFPWSYTDGKRGRGAMNAEYEYEPLYAHPAEVSQSRLTTERIAEIAKPWGFSTRMDSDEVIDTGWRFEDIDQLRAFAERYDRAIRGETLLEV